MCVYVCVCVCVCVSGAVTIRQCAESLSVRVGADHFLVSHHPGSGVIHLRMEGHAVKRQTPQFNRGKLKQHTDLRPRLMCVCVCVCVTTFKLSAVVCRYYACLHFLYKLEHI